MHKDTVAIDFVAEAIACLKDRGIDSDALLQECGIDPASLHTADGRVDASRFSRLWLRIAAAVDDEFFGLDRRRMKVGTYATLCRTATLAPTLGVALRTSIAILNLILDDLRLELRLQDEGDAELLLCPAAGAQPRVFAYETLLVLVYGMLCWLIDQRIPVNRATFGYRQPSRWREYEVMFCQELRFDASVTALYFPPEQLDAPVVQTAESATHFLRGAPLNVVIKYRNSRSASVQLRRLLRESDAAQLPSFDEAALHLNTHPARLRRALQREGVSYRTLRDNRLQEQATALLQDTDLSIDDIALQVGFSESSAFSRAFRRWTGQSPGHYRQQR